jgi:hypothetical protein
LSCCWGRHGARQVDFAGQPTATTVEVLTSASCEFSRNWPNRGTPEFTRFTLGLIAIQADLTGLTREQAKEKLRKMIKEFTGNPRPTGSPNSPVTWPRPQWEPTC